MKLLKLIYRSDTVAPMLALTFASGVSVTLVFARMAWTGNLRYSFLIWNLFLAWLPLIFALLARERYWTGTGAQSAPRATTRLRDRNWRFLGLAGAWLLFFPNAPYILTDLVHLTTRFHSHFWIDLTLILICAVTGLVLGFVSLHLMHSVVTRMLGRIAGWLFVGASAALCSFGIYLGRFLRFNSWDVFLRPDKIYHGIDAWLDTRVPHLSSAAFLILFATFLFVAYVMLYGLTHLPQAREMALPPGDQKLREA